jgi:hypothetical protein
MPLSFKKMPPWLKGKDDKDEKKGKKMPFGRDKDKGEEKENFKKALKSKASKLCESYIIAENVIDYCDYMRLGPALADTVVKRDEAGNVTDIRVPNSKIRNENRLLSFDWKTLNDKVKVLRSNAKSLHEDQNFIRAMTDLKRQNALSNNQGLEEVLENIVQAWPSLIYITQDELSQIIGEALRIADVNNFDDQTCAFMAEGILRTAHKSYVERVNQVLHLASATKCEAQEDEYLHFQGVVEKFYPSVDEKFGLERKVFSDLYESLEGVYHLADRRGDNALKHHTASYLNELADVLNDKAKADVELAEEVAQWLMTIIETNLSGGLWTVSNKPHITVSGDHPDMAKKAAQGYAPSKDFSGDWGDSAPMIGQDDMNYKGRHADQARSNSWGNIGGNETFPSLSNPYVPKPFGDYTMKGEKGVDKDATGQHGSTWQSKDTWPALQNPYVPKAETPSTYKVNHGKEKDLVVDK